MSAPACSIIIPTYNRLPYLLKAIASVQQQSFADWELLVVDDASSDGSFAAALALARDDARICVFRNPGAGGPAGARNAGMRQARADYIAFLDSDDLWDPDKLAYFMAGAKERPHAVLIGSDYRMVDQATQSVTTIGDIVYGIMMPWWERYERTAMLLPCEALKSDHSLLARADIVLTTTIAGYLWIHTSSVMVRRDAALAVGGFDEKLQRTEDIDLWLRLNEHGSIVFIDRQLASYDTTGRDGAEGPRYHAQDRSRRHTAYSEWTDHLALMKRIRRNHRLSALQDALLEDRLDHFHSKCAAAAWQAGNARRWFAHTAARAWRAATRRGKPVAHR